jgi:uncharacterized protein YndB with AHSA1/START domain
MSAASTPLRRSQTRDFRLTVKIMAKPDDVYRALTSARELCRWWLMGAETDARNAGRYRMVWPKIYADGGKPFPPHAAFGESEGSFVDLQPGRKVAWLWKLSRKKTFPPLSSFFISPLRRGSEVTLLHSGFPSDAAADKTFQGCAVGWEDCVAKLKLYLETGKTCKTQVLTLAGLRDLKKK